MLIAEQIMIWWLFCWPSRLLNKIVFFQNAKTLTVCVERRERGAGPSTLTLPCITTVIATSWGRRGAPRLFKRSAPKCTEVLWTVCFIRRYDPFDDMILLKICLLWRSASSDDKENIQSIYIGLLTEINVCTYNLCKFCCLKYINYDHVTT